MRRFLLSTAIVFWVASWTAHYTLPYACSDALPELKVNPYTNRLDDSEKLNTIDSVAHYCNRAIHLERNFEHKDDAEAFMKKCPKDVCTERVVEEVNE